MTLTYRDLHKKITLKEDQLSSPVACEVKTHQTVLYEHGVYHLYISERGTLTNQAEAGHQNIVLGMGPISNCLKNHLMRA